jgi:hypothetical protein
MTFGSSVAGCSRNAANDSPSGLRPVNERGDRRWKKQVLSHLLLGRRITSNQTGGSRKSPSEKRKSFMLRFTQTDVGYVWVEPGIRMEYTLEEPGNPPPTLRIARGAVAWAQQNKLTTLWVSAAKLHLWRCVRDLKYAIREARAQFVVRICKEIEQYPENEWYCSDSIQPRVRSRKEWRKRECILEWMPMFLYKRVAS